MFPISVLSPRHDSSKDSSALVPGKVMYPVFPKKIMAFPTTSDPCSNYSYVYIGWIHKKSPESCKETFSSVSLEEIYQSQGCVSSDKTFQVSISHCLGKRMWSPNLGSGAGCRAWVQEAGITPRVLYCRIWEAGASQGLRVHAQVYSTGAILTKR